MCRNDKLLHWISCDFGTAKSSQRWAFFKMHYIGRRKVS